MTHSQAQVEITNLHNNPGLLPIHLGPASIQEYTHKIIHYYDISLVIRHLNTLNRQADQLQTKIQNHTYYPAEFDNYLNLLMNTRNNIDATLYEILPKTKKKRGLINGLGSVFKSITGNLDYEDGQHFEQAIKNLEQNQQTLDDNINKQFSLSSEIINTFNQTISKLYRNEVTVESKLLEVEEILKEQVNVFNIHHIAEIFNQLQFMYQAIEKILDNLLTAITFSKLKILHPSILSTNELYNSLTKLKTLTEIQKLPFEVKRENIIYYSKLITVDSYVLNNKLVFILNVPIYHAEPFTLYQLYPIPIWHESNTFRLIVPDARYLLLSVNHLAREVDDCIRSKSTYFCKSTFIENLGQNCEANIIQGRKMNNCTQHHIEISKTQIQQIEGTKLWVILAPYSTNVKITCPAQQNIRSIRGTFLFKTTENCTLEVDQEIIRPTPVETIGQPVLLQFKSQDIEYQPKIFASSEHFDRLDLRNLELLKNQIKWAQPIGIKKHIPVYHGYPIYVFVIIVVIFLCFKRKILSACKSTPRPPAADVPSGSPDVQLPQSSLRS